MSEWAVLEELWRVIQDRKVHPAEGSYTCRLFQEGEDKIIKKFGEEAIEVIVAAKSGDRQALVWEVADVTYHLGVLLAHCGLTPDDILAELKRRRA